MIVSVRDVDREYQIDLLGISRKLIRLKQRSQKNRVKGRDRTWCC